MSRRRLLKSIQFFRNSVIILEYFIFLHEFDVTSRTLFIYLEKVVLPFSKTTYHWQKRYLVCLRTFSVPFWKACYNNFFFFFFVCSQRLVRSFYEKNIFHYVDLLVMAFRRDLRHIWSMISPRRFFFNPLSANITKWSNILKQFVGKLLTNCLSVFDHFVGFALKGLMVHVYLIHLKTFD